MNIDLEELMKMDDAQESKISVADIKKIIIDYWSYIWSKKMVCCRCSSSRNCAGRY